ncbi:MAG TPA: hypothetical protein VHL57_10845, partial [Flavobacteriales bacterium]|nr:hypothetical protein [Flavobacteriales bacterium]
MIGTSASAQEICDNGIDDDADGLIDLNDATDCSCSGTVVLPLPSFIPNPSFEQYNCLPSMAGELSCSTGWAQGTLGSTDYFFSGSFMPPSVPQPLPDGHACVGVIISQGYSEYLGTCLSTPLLAGNTYDLHMSVAGASIATFFAGGNVFYGPIALTVYGL